MATLSAIERIFFGLSFLMVFCLASYFISNIYQKYLNNPVIIGMDPVSTNIKDIPFPAITLCNMNQVKKSYAKTRKTQRSKLMLESICSQGDGLSNETNAADGKWSFVREFLLNASQRCDKMIQLCKFGNEEFDCSSGFRSVLTDEGLCCTFNSVHPKFMFKGFDEKEHVDQQVESNFEYFNWTPEQGYR